MPFVIKEVKALPIITISRQMSSFGDEIAASVASKLGWELLNRQTVLDTFLLETASVHERHMLAQSAKYYLKPAGDGKTFLQHIDEAVREYIADRAVVLLGFGSQMMFAGEREALHVRVVAPADTRRTRVKKQYRVSDEEAKQILLKADRKQKRFVSTLYDADLTDVCYYDMKLNTRGISVDEATAAVIAMYQQRKTALDIAQQAQQDGAINNLSDAPLMKNQAEIEFARLLDMYQIEWKYEPKTFPIEWDAEGNVTSAFSPDFYLTQFDTYIELTTMNQKYVTAKNRKVKKLKKLYPGTNIKIVYKKDFHSLVERFGLGKGEQ